MPFTFANLDLAEFAHAECEEGLSQRITWRLWGSPCVAPAFLAAARHCAVPADLDEKLAHAVPTPGAVYLGPLQLGGETVANGPFEVLAIEQRDGSLSLELAETLLTADDLTPRWELHAEADGRFPAPRLPVDISLSNGVLGRVTEAFRKCWGANRRTVPAQMQTGVSDLQYLRALAGRLGRAAATTEERGSAGFLVGSTGRNLILAFPFSPRTELVGLHPDDYGLRSVGAGPAPMLRMDLGAIRSPAPFCEHWESDGQHELAVAFGQGRSLPVPCRLDTADGPRVVIARRWRADAVHDHWEWRLWACVEPAGWASPPPADAAVAMRVVAEKVDPVRWTVLCRPADERFAASGEKLELALSTPFAGDNRRRGVHLPPVAGDVGLMIWSGELLDFPVWSGTLRPVEKPEGASDEQDVRRLGLAAMEVAGIAQSFCEGKWLVKTGHARIEAAQGAVELQSGERGLSVNKDFVDVT